MIMLMGTVMWWLEEEMDDGVCGLLQAFGDNDGTLYDGLTNSQDTAQQRIVVDFFFSSILFFFSFQCLSHPLSLRQDSALVTAHTQLSFSYGGIELNRF
jgi:hypothetical protein